MSCVTAELEASARLETVQGAEQAERMFQVARAGLIGLVLAAPLTFGAVEPWAWGAMVILTGGILLLWAAGCVRAGVMRCLWSHLYVPAAALLALAAAQLWLGLSLDRIATRESLIKLLMYIAIFFLGQQLFAGAPRAWRISGLAVAVYAFAIAVFAIIQFFASPGTLYGVVKPRWGGWIFGPYVSHNNYAGLMEMLIPISVAYTLGMRPRHPAKVFLMFASLICYLSVLLSGSRGGTIALVVEILIFAAAAGIGSRAGRRQIVLLAGAGLAALAGVFFSCLDPGQIWQRWEQTAHTPELELQFRNRISADSLRMFRDNLESGVGLGAFEVAYPRYQTYVTDRAIDYAHNDYAQLFAETGVLGCLLALISIVLFAALAFRGLRSRLEQSAGWLQLGAAVGVCGILVHSFSDFNLHIPANTAWFSFCCALASLPPRPRVQGA